jgi:tRNA modification GTPase
MHALAQRIVNLRVLVEATLDFPEEEIDFLERADADGQLARIVAAVTAVRARARQGALLREGLRVVLAGQPNVGKSSLLNALAGAELAIVTAIPGTTRDRINETIQIEGVPIHIVDTAGLREDGAGDSGSDSADDGAAAVGDRATTFSADATAVGNGPIAAPGRRRAESAGTAIDEVERIGIARSWEAIADADAILFMHDLTRRGDPTYEAAEAAIAQRLATAPRGHVIDVDNKVDAVARDLAGAAAEAPVDGPPGAAQILKLSAKTGQGLAELRAALLAVGGWTASPEGVFIARSRHLDALSRCAEHLADAGANAQAPIPALDLYAEDLRLAHDALGEITGAFTPDDLLGEIFGRFCIGK